MSEVAPTDENLVRATLGRSLGELSHERLNALRTLLGDAFVDRLSGSATDVTVGVGDPYDAEAQYDQFENAGFPAGIIVDEQWEYEAPGHPTIIVFETTEGKDAFIRELVRRGVPVAARK